MASALLAALRLRAVRFLDHLEAKALAKQVPDCVQCQSKNNIHLAYIRELRRIVEPEDSDA